MKNILIAVVLFSSSALFAADAGIEKAKQLFATTCATCHGPDGKGDTEIGKNIKARNLTADPFKKGDKEEEIFKTITNGIEGTAMAAFGPQIPEADRKLLAKFVVSLRPSAAKKADDKKPEAPAKKK